MGKKKKVTISSIAKELNVSAISVSRALSNQPGVSDELRKKIVAKAKELGYKKRKCNEKINVLVLIKRRYVADNSNFSYMVQGIENHIKKSGAEFTVEFIEPDKQKELVLPYNLERNKDINGVILLGKFDPEYVSFINSVVTSVLVFNGISDKVVCDHVYYNFNRIGYQAAEYLIKKGHRKIGMVGSEGKYNQRFLGMCRALDDYQVPLYERYIIPTKEELADRLDELVKANDLPTAFICRSDHLAFRLIKYLHEHGLSVPDDVSVIGSGNTDMAQIAIPALTTFDLNIEFACEVAVNTLLNHIMAEHNPSCTTYIDGFLVERDSVRTIEEGAI